MKIKALVLIGAMALAGGSFRLKAGEEAAPNLEPAAPDPWNICDLFDLVKFYDNPDNPFLQSLAFTGRLQADAAFFDADDGLGDYERLTWRRARAGFKAQVWNDFTLHSEADFNLNDTSDLYNRLTDSYVAWSRSDAFELKVGKQSAGFLLDGATSSKKLITIDRSNLANNLWFPVEYHTGIAANGEVDKWSYNVGFFASDRDPEFSKFEAGQFGLVSLGYDFAERFGIDTALLRADYVYNDPNEDNTGTRSLRHVASLTLKLEEDKWGLWSNVAAGDGYLGQSDLWGIQLMPFYNFTDKLQAVLRYTYLNSSDDNGVRLARYENRITRDRGDEYNEIYLGLNYYICGHKMKIQTGLKYTDMDDSAGDGGDYSGWGWTTGFRLSW